MIRLHKLLAASGVASRRQCEQLMLAGRVTVDGKEVRDPAFQLEPGGHEVRVDGELVHEQAKFYFAVNKPAGHVCTHRDPQGRPRAIDLVPIEGLALFTVGRLDASSEGLLLVMNDGGLAERLARPAFQVERTYRVQVAGHPAPEALESLKRGMRFAEGTFRARDVKRVAIQGKTAWLELVLTEGRNREIRRLMARVGHKVLHLERVAFGPVRLGKLPSGEFRELTPKELAGLHDAVKRKGRGRGQSAPRRSSDEANETVDEVAIAEAAGTGPGRPRGARGPRAAGAASRREGGGSRTDRDGAASRRGAARFQRAKRVARPKRRRGGSL